MGEKEVVDQIIETICIYLCLYNNHTLTQETMHHDDSAPWDPHLFNIHAL